MHKKSLSRVVVALGLAHTALSAHAVNPPEYDIYTKQLWMEETASDLDGGGLSPNYANVNQSGALSGVVDINQNGEANRVDFQQNGAGNVMRVGQGASYDASAQDWADRWSGGDAVRGNSVTGYQYNSNNSGTMTQAGDYSGGSIYQYSGNNTASISQDGNSGASITQWGNGGNSAKIEQLGNSAAKFASINQFSVNGTTAKVRQNDTNEVTETVVFQWGTSANADINQSGGYLHANQFGENNNLRVGQTNAVRFSQRQWNYDPNIAAPPTGGMNINQNGVRGLINIDSNQARTGALSGSINQSGDLGQVTVINDTWQEANSPEVYIQQSGSNQNVKASFAGEGGILDIQQANGDGIGSNTIRAAVSGGASMTLNQEGSGNLIDAELGGGSLTVGSTNRSAGGTGAAGQLGTNNRLVVRGNAGTITAMQDGSNNKMHLGASVGYSGAEVTSVETSGSGISGGTLNLAQSGDNNLINVAGTTSGANLTVNQNGGAKVDLGTVSSTVNIMQ